MMMDLPCAGFPGKDDQARPEFQVELVNDGEVLDVQFSQHMHPYVVTT